MTPFQKNKWLGVFSDLVQEVLLHLNWTVLKYDNLSQEERLALRKLKEAPKLMIKKSDIGGNVVLLSKENHEN